MAVRPPPCLSMWQENKLRSLCTEKTGLKKIIRKQGCVHYVLVVGVIIAWLRLHVLKIIGYKTIVLQRVVQKYIVFAILFLSIYNEAQFSNNFLTY